MALRNNSIRARFSRAACGLAVALSLGFIIPVYLIFDQAEDVLIDEHFAADMATFLAEYAVAPAISEVPRTNFRVYVAKPGETETVPPGLLALGPDEDEFAIDGRHWDVRKAQQAGQTFYFLFDETPVERFEWILIIATFVIGGGVLLLAIAASIAIARRISTPITELAHRVSRLDAGEALASMEESSSNDEVAVLATAVDRYQRRIQQLLQREREFSADVSHELRTPLMALHSAAELLALRTPDVAGVAEPIQRIQRGCLQMSALTESLLYLAREPTSFNALIERVDIAHAVAEQVSGLRDLVHKDINVELLEGASTTIDAIPAVVNIVLGNVLKNALKHSDGKRINVQVTGREVVIQDFGKGVDDAVKAKIFERFAHAPSADGVGIGLALVKRFCDEYGWTLDFRSEKNRGTRVAIAF
jgi:signal transduction histidine kinase